MSDATFGSSSSSSLISLPLADGTRFIIINTYSKSQSRAVGALVAASCVSLAATVGLLAAIAMSAFNTRTLKNPNMFVRTHVVFYFVSLLVCDILQAIGSIMSSAWTQRMAIVYGSLCTVQGIIKHVADVGIAVWSLVIAARTFLVLFLRVDVRRSVMWLVLLAQWSLVGAIVIAGPATARSDKHGPFYGISGDWCWISPNYDVQRIILDYMVMFISALLASMLYSLVFLQLRGIARAQAPSTTTIASVNQELHKQYEHRLARQMLLYPIAYTIMIVPITCCRFLAWAGHNVPFGAIVFSDLIYLLSGLVHVILFACTRRILPPRSILPKFLISTPTVLVSSTALADNDFEFLYGGPVTRPPTSVDEEKSRGHSKEHASGIHQIRSPFSDRAYPPIDAAIVKRVDSPDSGYSDALPSSHHTDEPIAADYVDWSVLPEPFSPQDHLSREGEGRLGRGPDVPTPPDPRESKRR